MSSLRAKNVMKYVIPAMLSSVCFFLFTTVDGIFVGRGVGTNGLGAMNLIGPFVMTLNALTMMLNIGGVTILAICIGKGDSDGANKAFRHGLFLLMCVSAFLSFIGVFFTDTICSLLGAGETHHQLAAEYLFWYSAFIIPSSLSYGLQNYCRNDGAPGLVGLTTLGSTVCNIFGDWLLIFPFQMGMKGAAIATGVSQSLGLFVMLTHLIRKQGVLRLGRTKLEGGLIRDIIIHGLPEGISQLAMGTGFHHHELTFGNGLQLVRRHKRPLRHLEGLAVFPFAPADGAGLHRVAAQGAGELIGGLTVGRESTEYRVLAIILQELLHHLELLLRGGLSGMAGTDALRTLAGGNVTDVVAEMRGGFCTAALDMRALENDARRKQHLPWLSSILN